MSDCFVATTEVFGSNVFSDSCMKETLPRNIYKAFRRTIENREPLDPAVADVVANAMKDWAIAKGATHYCHWFQPMTGLTAEKHDSFISPTSDGKILMEFSGKELTQGEPDASSFPSGGLRATFEARGYTAWDCTSPVFIKKDGDNITLHIPSAFCSYNGEALDKKTPLLRSMDALDRNGMRVLRALGNTSSKCIESTLGPEQEYFLVDRAFFEKRLDLVLAKRTLFGAPSPRGQEMDDHYFGTLHERVASFMHEVNIELWKLGVSAKTQHNEVSPAQYEIAPVFSTVNVATDHNQLTMEILEQVALRHGFVCLLNEKPFAGVNGSGKHVNWSACTDDGINLLEPGSTPHDNMVFLVFLSAVIRGVDKYARLMRASVANTGNEHRLGANEAPPAIVSIFLGDQLMDIFEQLANGGAKTSKQGGSLQLGVSTLPTLPKDCTDRNRTSPFAFTGNKFEFRMPGSTQSSAGPAYVINTIIADILSEFADELESSDNPAQAAQDILTRVATDHKRVLFNGDNYNDEWVKEAEKRGLANIPSTVEALKAIADKEHIELFERQRVLTAPELHARAEILLQSYAHEKNIEAKCMINIARRQIMPAAVQYCEKLAASVTAVVNAGITNSKQKQMLESFANLIDQLYDATDNLENITSETASIDDIAEKAAAFRDKVVPAMDSLRIAADQIEMTIDARIWPLPTYAEMLFLK